MDDIKPEMSTPIESDCAAEWLTDMLRISYENLGSEWDLKDSVLSESSDRYREAVGVALSLTKLRKERERIGFVPLGLAEYVLGLVNVTGISIPPILNWLGISDLSRPSASTARALARLSRELGIGLREALIHIRIGFAAHVDSAPMPLLVARLRASGMHRTQVEECEAVLGQIESEYEIESMKELRSTEFEIRAAYRESDSRDLEMR